MVYNGCMASQYLLLSLYENSLERSEFAPKSVMINRGCSSAVLACTCLERESLLLPAMMSLVACCPLSDELGQCGELSLPHRFGLASENGCATERTVCSAFAPKGRCLSTRTTSAYAFTTGSSCLRFGIGALHGNDADRCTEWYDLPVIRV